MTASVQRWYVAVLIVKVVVAGQREKRPLFDRQFKLIRAASHEKAYAKALKIGKAAGFWYKNPGSKRVSWKFVGLADLDLIRESELKDGVEIYSFVKRGNPERAIRRKPGLEIFWHEANKRRPLKETTSPSRLRYAPISALKWVARRIESRRAATAASGSKL